MGVNRYLGGVVSADPNTPTVTSASGTWTLEEAYQNIGNWPMAQSQIQNSLRFNSADSASLSRTPSVASNRRTWTWSGWVKRSEISDTERVFFSAGTDGNNFTALEWINSNLYLQNYTSGVQTITNTTAVFRDASAWYHIVLAVDTTQTTAANRAIIYVNGVQQAGFSGTPFSQNQQFWINYTYTHRIGARQLSSVDAYSNQYMTEVNFIDGLALSADYFGFFDANGIWQPKPYKGAYGTNGFYLPMSVTESAPTWYYNPMATFSTYNRQGSFSNTSASIYLTGAGYDGGYMGGTVSPGSFAALQNNWNLDFILNRDCVNSSPFPNYTIEIGRASSANSYYSGSGNSIATVIASNNYNFNWYVYNGNGTQLYTGGGSGSSYAYAGVAVRISFNATTYTFTFYGNTSGSFTGMTQLGTYTLSAGEKSAMQSSYENSNFYIGSAYRGNNDGWRDVRWYTTA